MFEISTIIALVLSFVIIVLGSWFISRDKDLKDGFMVMDLAVTAFVFFFVVSRVLGLIMFDADLPLGWSLLPVTQSGSMIALLDFWPWIIFAINDGRFLLIDVFGGFFLAEVLFRLLNGRRMTTKNLIQPRNDAFAIYSLALLPVFISAYLNNYLLDYFDPSIVAVTLVLLLVAAAVSIYFRSDPALASFIRASMQLFMIVMINGTYTGNHSLVLINLIIGGLFILSLLKTLLEVSLLTPVEKVKRQPPEINLRRHNFSYQSSPDAQFTGSGVRGR